MANKAKWELRNLLLLSLESLKIYFTYVKANGVIPNDISNLTVSLKAKHTLKIFTNLFKFL